MIAYNFCPKCSKKLLCVDDTAICSNCEIKYYQNSKPCASVLIIKGGKVLLARRSVEPYKGQLDTIGGFLEYGEDPRAGAIREAKEETGLDIKLIALLGIYTDTYGDGGDATLSIHYIGEIIGGKEQAQDDVAALEWVPLNDLPVNEGFKNTREALTELKKYISKNTRSKKSQVKLSQKMA